MDDSRVRDLERSVARLRARELRRSQQATAWRRGAILGLGLLAAGLPVMGLALTGVPNPPMEAQVISASDMRENFDHLVDGITAREPLVVRYETATAQIIDSGVVTRVQFNDLDFETDEGLVTTGSQWSYACPEDGLYRVTAMIRFDLFGTWANHEYLELRLNRDDVLEQLIGYDAGQDSTGNSGRYGTQGSAVIECAIGQTLSVDAVQTSGGNLALDGSATRNWVVIERL